MFPWCCLSIDLECVYSEKIRWCFGSDQRYIRVLDEREITRKANLIAVKAKNKKKLIMQCLKGDYYIDPELQVVGRMIESQENSLSMMKTTRSLIQLIASFTNNLPSKLNTAENIATLRTDRNKSKTSVT